MLHALMVKCHILVTLSLSFPYQVLLTDWWSSRAYRWEAHWGACCAEGPLCHVHSGGKNWKIFWTLQRCILIVWSTLYLLRQTLSRRSTTSGAAKMVLRVLWAGDRLRATNKDYQTLVFTCIFHGSSSCGCQSRSCWWTPFHRFHILCWHCGQSVVLVGGAWDWSGGTIANKLDTAPFLRSRIGCWVFWVWGVQYWDRTLTSHHPIKWNTYCYF